MKIICIGLSKTGTTSLASAMDILGYNVCDFIDIRTRRVADMKSVEHYDFLSDTPMCLLYKKIKQQYPDSKFIHTVRDFESWINSIEGEFKGWKWTNFDDGRNEIFKRLYGKELNFIDTYYTYNSELENTFKNDFNYMKLDICSGEKWQKLCAFVNKPVPTVEFPWKNKKQKI